MMPGYEDLTPDQIIYLGNLFAVCILVFATSMIVRSFLNLRTARYIHLRIEKEIIAKVNNEIFEKKPFVVKIKEWWSERKRKKEEKLLGKPLG